MKSEKAVTLRQGVNPPKFCLAHPAGYPGGAIKGPEQTGVESNQNVGVGLAFGPEKTPFF